MRPFSICNGIWSLNEVYGIASLAQLAEHPLSKREVVGSNPTGGFCCNVVIVDFGCLALHTMQAYEKERQFNLCKIKASSGIFQMFELSGLKY